MTPLEYFFIPEPLWYVAGEGFALFGPEHLVALVACAALIAALSVAYRMASNNGRKLQQRIMAGTAIGLLAMKDLSYVALGLFVPLFWPLHICNFCEYLAVVAAFWPGTRVGRAARGVLICWAALGCTGALLFPGWSYYTPALTWANISSFAEHALVLGCVVCMAAAREEGPSLTDVGASALAAVVFGALARLINPLLGTNFLFVTKPSTAGGPFVWLEQTFPNPWYLAAYLGIACAFWLALSLAWQIRSQRQHQRQKCPKEQRS